MINYKNDNMIGVVSPTDSRWRKDVDFWEKGLEDEAEKAKIDIEQEQRRKRKLRSEGTSPQWKPNFFRPVPHPYLKTDVYNTGEKDPPIYYQLIENEGDNKGYWERRKNKDWDDMPKLFGPFDPN